jgi:hypothetical protein
VHSSTLRDEGRYKIEVSLKDEQSSFKYTAKMTFVPLLTTWFEPIHLENNYGDYDKTPRNGDLDRRRLMASSPEQEVHRYAAGQALEFQLS